MSDIYVVGEDGSTHALPHVRCADEGKELQRLLEKNPGLLPGDQIDPEDPRRWLLVKREMPVPDPNTGANRWSIDFLLVDQDAIPTFVECKRFNDTRSRREVVGQVLDYAANANAYWTKEELRGFAESTSHGRQVELEEMLLQLRPNEDLGTDAFFERLEENLRQGQVRIVFVLEDSSYELRSVVDFLNKQMERTEVLLVEARQYTTPGGQRVLVPTLFGFTEQARAIKRPPAPPPTASRRTWDRDQFFETARSRLGAADESALRAIYDAAVESGYEISWGSGKDNGSFSLKAPSIGSKSLISVLTNGQISFNYGWLNQGTAAVAARDRLKDLVEVKLHLVVPDDYVSRWQYARIEEWRGVAAEVCLLVKELAATTL
jgi:hypothetical protein